MEIVRYNKKMVRKGVNFFLVLVVLCGETSCSYAQKHQDNTEISQTKKTFTLPDIPQVLTSHEDRAAYLVSHYWDNFDFVDTTLVSKPEVTEQAFVDFINILSHVKVENAQKALTNMMDSASMNGTIFIHFMDLAEKYLYDPNSPFRDEELYIPILNTIIESTKLAESHKTRPRFQLKTAMKNRPGYVATDFVYTLSTGSCKKMSSIKSDYTILFFNNPDCHDCKRVKDYIESSALFNHLTRTNSVPSLSILGVYPDADIPLWKRAEYPSLMINSYDAGQVITNKELYDLKAIPTFYLLDSEKKVIMKDASIEQIEAWLQMLLNN